MAKYKLLTHTTKKEGEHTLHRIMALEDFADVKKGDLGGWIECEENLSHVGDCWIYDNAMVFGDAQVSNNAKIKDGAMIFDDAQIFHNAYVSGECRIFENANVFNSAQLFEYAKIFGNAKICGNSIIEDAVKVYGNAFVSRGRLYGHVSIGGNVRIINNAELGGYFTLFNSIVF